MPAIADRKMLILDDDRVPAAAAIAASGFLGEHEPANVAHPEKDLRWATDDPQASLTVDFGAAHAVQAVALVFHPEHGLPGGDLRLRLDPDGGAAGTGAAHDSGWIAADLVAGCGARLHLLPAEIQARYLHVAYALTGLSRFDLAWVLAGLPWQPADNFSFGAVEGWVDPTESLRTAGGALHPDHRPGWRTWSLALELMPAADRDRLAAMARRLGTSGRFLFCRAPIQAASETAVCRFAASLRIARPIALHHDAPLEIEELI